MKSFELHEPTTVGDAVTLLTNFGARGKALAGGSDLVGGVMKDWVQGRGMPIPTALVDLTAIPDMRGIAANAQGITIGAATTLTDVAEDPDIKSTWPIL